METATHSGYYSNPGVQARMLEFLCAQGPGSVTAEYLTAGDKSASLHRDPQPTSNLHALLDNDREICRSLWDECGLLVHLDVDYVNFDFPGEAYVNPQRVFDLLMPVEAAITSILREFAIHPLRIVSGRGPHFAWLIKKNSTAFQCLVKMGHVSPELERKNALRHRPRCGSITPQLGNAYSGLGLLMEFLAHLIKGAAAARCKIPVEITAVEAGPGPHGREMISLDISEYGDPLSTRVVRIPFSRYLKPWQQKAAVGEHVTEKLPPMFSIPEPNEGSREPWQIMRDEIAVAALAARTSAAIPDASEPMNAVISAYQKSALKKFHDWFYEQEPHVPADWPATYDRLGLDILPLCVRRVLEYPNDLLLRPANIERLVRVMLALGWHPRHIEGLVRSKFERDYNWGGQWKGYDPGLRAEFYTRLFAGLFVAGTDDLVDFNCQSVKEEKLCPGGSCGFNLEHYRTSLLDRRKYERLACRPFNRLFLPEEHF